MRIKLMACMIAVAFPLGVMAQGAVQPGGGTAGSLSSVGTTGASSAISTEGKSATAPEPPASSRAPRSRPRNPVDRSAADPGAATFKSFDVDKDGYVSRDEAKASSELTRQFNALDKDRDGKLSLREVTGWRDRSYTGAIHGHAPKRSN